MVLAVLLVFSRTLSQGFLNYDDNVFVYMEPHVSGGFSWSGVAWAFTSGPEGEWYPLAMLSHMLDCQLYGLNPAGHHLTSLLLHAASAVTLFLVLWRMTGELWPSALVAALFALHPLRVESVAWVAERRDVLSGLFFMLTLGAYGEYVRHPQSLGRYLAVVGFFALGLLAKAMLVTLPPLLLLLDFWPFARFRRAQPESFGRKAQPAPFPWRPILDKLPLFALALAAAGVTLFTHNPLHTSLTLPERLAGAAVSYVAYLGQLFVPVGLSIFYSHPEAGRPAWHVAGALALLLAITAAAVIGRRSYPYFFVGWFWYIGMLVPVIGVTFVGGHARADRYTYLSQIGLYIALVWGAMRLGASWPARRWVFGVGSALALAALMAGTWRQTGFWQDSKTLWEHALACDPNNITARYLLGQSLRDTDEAGAVAQYRQALEIGPYERNIYGTVRAQIHNALGELAARTQDVRALAQAQSGAGFIAPQAGNLSEAMAHYHRALEADCDFAPAHLNLGDLLAKQGNLDEAKIHFQRSIELSPVNAAFAHCNLAAALTEQGKNDEAIANFRKALAIEPRSGHAHSRLAELLADRGDVDEAIVHVRQAIEIDPDVAFPCYQLARLLRRQGRTSEAAMYDERGGKASRRYAETQNLRGTELAQQGKVDQAIAQFEMAIAIFPDFAQAHNNLADALALQGNIDGAIVHYRRALAIDPNFAPAKRSFEQLLNR